MSAFKSVFVRHRLKKATKDNSQKIDFKECKYIKVFSCYDGDTITGIVRRYNRNIIIRCRIFGIDTPELRTRDPTEKEAAIKAKEYIESLILDKIVGFEYLGEDKYGRILCKITVGGKDLSSLMIQSGHAKEYMGGKKEPFSL